MTWFSRDVLGLEPAGEDESVTFQRLATHGRDLVEVYAQEHRDVRMRLRFPRAAGSSGGVAERSNAAVSKTVRGGFVPRGFKSLPLRSTTPNPASLSGIRRNLISLAAR